MMKRAFFCGKRPRVLLANHADSPTARQIELRCSVNDIVIEAAAGDGNGDVVPRFLMVAYTGGPMRIEGWRFPVVVDLDGLAIPSQRRPVRFGHSMFAGVGHTERIAIEGGQLIAEGVVSRDTAAAREVVNSGKRGFPWQASIGATVLDTELVRSGQSVTVNGQTFNGPLYVARKTQLGEISFVDLGADMHSSARIAAESGCSPEAAGCSHNKVTTVMGDDREKQQTTENASAATDKKVQAHGTDADVSGLQPAVSSLRSEAAEETRRIAAIRRVCGGQFGEIEAQAIGDGWTAERCELEVLRASRPKAPAVHMIDSSVNSQMLEAACMLSAKLADVERLYDDKTLEAANRRYRGGIGLQELLLEAAWANGYTGRNFRNSRAVLRYAFAHDLQAAFSTIDIGGILSNVANKFLLEGFFHVERTWRNITSVRNVSDFKTVTSYRLIGKDQYEQVAPGGALKHGSLGDESYTNKADTYGLMLSIDRRDIINDDLGAITTVPRKLGRGSGLKINDVFWTTFLSNADFFKAANKNYIEGADTALGIDGLTKAEVTFMDQVDADRKPIGVMPAILLLPTSLSAMGTVLFKSLEIRDTSASAKYPVANPHAGKFRAEVSRYLTNVQYPGSSDKAWYLLADPSDLAVIEVAFLNGQEAPTIETAEADFNVLGIQMRGFHDFGIALQDPKGGVKAKGEA